MADTLTDRLARIDAAIAGHRAQYLHACHAGERPDVADEAERQAEIIDCEKAVNRLLLVRFHVQQKAALTASLSAVSVVKVAPR